ncbi:MAG: 3-dehydroquinate synthase [Myxococcota bacterium]|nr:3-dehydroquinate synthase [Myxococcota bacterium]
MPFSLARTPRLVVQTSTGEKTPVVFGRRIESLVPAVMPRKPGFAWIIADRNVQSVADRLMRGLRGLGWQTGCSVIPPGEKTKKMSTIEGLCSGMHEGGLDRGGCVVAVGGGVTGDVAGFAASVYMRGIPVVQVPTSLIAMVDACIGGKTGVNLPGGKNLAGTFHQPYGAAVAADLLKTLPPRHYRSGLAEVVKYAVVFDRQLFKFIRWNAVGVREGDERLMLPVIRRCLELKAGVLRMDTLEHGKRAILNFGHTWGHAIEAAGGFRRLTHGEAVAMGMVLELKAASNLGMADASLAEAAGALLQEFGLPVKSAMEWRNRAAPWLAGDKKKLREAIPLVGFKKAGAIFLRRVNIKDILDATC